MSGPSSLETKAQLDKAERENLEKVVRELRNTVESDIEYQLEHTYSLKQKDGAAELTGEDADLRAKLVEAVEREDEGKSWAEMFEDYVMGVGYTLVNRLTALRCMEVRGFINRPVTQFGDSGTTPAAERLENEEYLAPEDAIVEAFERECRNLAEEVEILFNPDSPYTILEIDVDVYRDLCEVIDKVPDDVWLADDVLGWVYEYYNRPIVEKLEDKNKLEADEIPAANQFYTPHWVVRLLTDNSLAKLYLESNGELQDVVQEQSVFSIDERKSRLATLEKSPSITDFCTYLVPDKKGGDATDFDHPSEIRIIDPACGSGHFLLYAFDVLERIWRRECPKMDFSEIPEKILENNLYGVDLDLRSCQLATFNLYLKARTQAESAGNDSFELPRVGIVCADARVADIESVDDILGDTTSEEPELEQALQKILDAFENTPALGSLLDVKGTLEDVFDTEEQVTIQQAVNGTGSLSGFLRSLQQKLEEQSDSGAFAAQDLRSFLKLLVVLTQDYDVALMNPPYGARGRMPKQVSEYIKEHRSYKYAPEYYINFFEVCDRLSKENGRIGMLVKREFMFKNSLADFREDFIGEKGSFDFLAEFGEGILDKAKVRGAGTVVRTDSQNDEESAGTFIRLHDVSKEEKEKKFLESTYVDPIDDGVKRVYTRKLSEFSTIPGSHMSYWAPEELREIFDSDVVFDADNAGVNRDSFGNVKVGLQTGDDDRFTRYFWETDTDQWVPFAKGGEDAWTLPRVNLCLLWGDDGREIKLYSGSYPRNTQYYFSEALTYTYMKSSGRRFGYLHPSSVFGHAGNVFLPKSSSWSVMGYGNSHMVTYLMACLDPGRHWEVGNVSKLPWYPELSEAVQLRRATEKILGLLLYRRTTEFNSPYFTTPGTLKMIGYDEPLSMFEGHPHRELLENTDVPDFATSFDASSSIRDIALGVTKINKRIEAELEERALDIDDAVFNFFELDEELRTEVKREISLRTNQNPFSQLESVGEVTEPEDYEEQVKDLVLYLALKSITNSKDGIIPVTSEPAEYDTILDLVLHEAQAVFGSHHVERLNEIDAALGDERSSEEAYPNLKKWLDTNLFDYHLEKFEKAPVIWRLSSSRLVADPEIEGFGCFIDYHRFSASTFDQIQTNYLEARKEALSELRAAANQRRDDSSLSSSERAEAAERFSKYENGVRQITEFEKTLLRLSEAQERDWDESSQTLARELKEDLERFRKRMKSRVDSFKELIEISDEDWLAETFTDTFSEYVLENEDDWFRAIEGGIEACDVYSEDASKPVAAHYYDFLLNCQDNIGTTSYHRNGILFLHHYFGKKDFRNLLENGSPREGMAKQETLLAELAAGIDGDAELGDNIKEKIESLTDDIEINWSGTYSSDWEGRALDEIMTGGYHPIKKYGVAVNIRPLTEEDLVPKEVESDVLL
ncbi:BREX-5 system adenine-specific DNA-methyltransferase PglX (plasmid) [Haloferacaceae archaeon DSL9]